VYFKFTGRYAGGFGGARYRRWPVVIGQNCTFVSTAGSGVSSCSTSASGSGSAGEGLDAGLASPGFANPVGLAAVFAGVTTGLGAGVATGLVTGVGFEIGVLATTGLAAGVTAGVRGTGAAGVRGTGAAAFVGVGSGLAGALVPVPMGFFAGVGLAGVEENEGSAIGSSSSSPRAASSSSNEANAI